MKRICTVVLSLSFILLVIYNCKDEPPVVPPTPPAPKATLSLKDKSCTEFWLNLQLENFTLPVNVQLIKDNLLQTEINGLSSNDTTIYIDSLLPNKDYNFKAVVSNNEQRDTSHQLQATTLDTTSHIFSYQTYELGDPLTGNSSILYDVAIVDANNIYAVGEIYVTDSIGQTIIYNVVHWDGSEWELKKLTYQGIPPVIHSVCAIEENDIWFDPWFHWNGQNFQELPINPIFIGVGVNRLWGNADGIYVVGNNGFIAHKNTNGTWQEIASGTEFPLVDIYSKDGNEIYISGAYTPEIKGILLNGNANQFSVMINAEIISENELFEKLYGELASVWVDEIGTVYTGGNLLFRYKNDEWNYVTSLPENFIGGNPGTYYRGFITSTRGNASNDYLIAGDRNTLKHFNGVSWEQIGLPYSPTSPIIWYKVEQKANTTVAVGDKGSYAFIILLTR